MRTITNEQLLSEYGAELRLKLSSGQFPQYFRTLNEFINFCGGLPPTRHLAVAYLNQFQDRAPATRRRYYNIIKGLFTSDSGLADKDFNIAMPNPKPLPQVVTDEEFYKLIDSMAMRRSFRGDIKHDKLLVLFLGRTGLRREEAANLKISDIQIGEKPQVLVRAGKGGKDRAVPIIPELLKPLSDFIDGKPANQSLFGLDKAVITDKISRYGKKVGLNLHPHSLRHYCAEWLLRNGYTAKEVQEWLGHARLDTTGRYLDLAPDSLHEAVKRTTTNRPLPNQDAVAQTIQELSGFTTRVGDIDINAFAVLGRLWGDFTGGMTPAELLTRLTKEFSLSVVDPQGFWDATMSLLEEFSLYQVIRLEQRRRGTARDKIDVDYWVLTDYGKMIVLMLRRENRQQLEA